MINKRPYIIAGPCSAETRQQTLDTCRALAELRCVDMLRAGIWKPRTMPGGFEGMGVEGLKWMKEASQATGLPFTVEVATSAHVQSALEYGASALWVGARTTGNPFSVQEIADALAGVKVPVLIKNPMNPDIALWEGAVERMAKVGVGQISLIHRGFSGFGMSIYRNAPMWHLALEMRMRMPEIAMLCDPSHICGNRELLADVAQEAADLNYDGLIVESHIAPDNALSDASQQLTPQALGDMLRSIVWRRQNIEKSQFEGDIKRLRQQIDLYDAEMFALIGRRMNIAEEIGHIKRENAVTIFQPARWDNVRQGFLAQAQRLNLSRDFVTTLLDAIHVESIAHQNKVMNK